MPLSSEPGLHQEKIIVKMRIINSNRDSSYLYTTAHASSNFGHDADDFTETGRCITTQKLEVIHSVA